MPVLHSVCKVQIEQRHFKWRCSVAFLSVIFSVCGATVFGLMVAPAVAQLAPSRPITKAPPPVTPVAPAPLVPRVEAPVAPQVLVKEFRSLGDLPAILYDAPSVKAKKLSILSALNPLEILARTDRWLKVRDAVGEIGWVEANVVTERRLVTVIASTAQIRTAAVATDPLAFEAERGVVLEILGSAADGWLAVRHRDGSGGFVLRSQVFGQ